MSDLSIIMSIISIPAGLMFGVLVLIFLLTVETLFVIKPVNWIRKKYFRFRKDVPFIYALVSVFFLDISCLLIRIAIYKIMMF